MKSSLFIGLMLLSFSSFAQTKTFKAKIVNASNGYVMENVNILNLNKIKGTTSDSKGYFNIEATANDTIYLSFLGFKPLKVRVTNDMIKFKNTELRMSELAYALEEVIIKPYRLTGYLSIDAKNTPINVTPRYSISGLPRSYESRGRASKFNKVMSSIFNPADFLYNTFNREKRQLKKLQDMRKNDVIRKMLVTKFDRNTIVSLLNIQIYELENILRHCDYSKQFIQNSNDLQILQALSDCYEEYKVLKNNL